MALITYENKVALNENPDIADINKCRATDMNEIKNVVNENYNELNEKQNLVRLNTDGQAVETGRIIDNKKEYIKRITCANMGSGTVTTTYQTGIDVANSIITNIEVIGRSAAGNWFMFPNNDSADSKIQLNNNGQLSITHYTNNWQGATAYANISYISNN